MPIALFSTAVLSTALGSWVFIDHPSKALNKSFFLLCISIGGWAALIGFSELSFDSGLVRGPHSIGLGYLFGSLIPYLFYLTCRNFHGPAVTRPALNIIAVIACASCTYLGFTGRIVEELKIVEGSDYYQFVRGWGFPAFLIYVLFLAGLSIREILTKYRLSQNEKVKLQLTYFAIGSGLSFTIALVCNVILPTLGISDLGPYGATSPLIALSVLSIAITRHRLLDVAVSSQWTTIIALWIVALWVPTTIYLLISSDALANDLTARYRLIFGLTIWVITLYIISRFAEKSTVRERERIINSQRHGTLNETGQNNHVDLLKDLIEALIHDLNSRLTIAIIDAKGNKTYDKSELTVHLRDSIEQLKSISTYLASDRIVGLFRMCDLSEILSDILISKQPIISRKSITVTIGSMPKIVSIPKVILHIFSNIMDNACKYAGDKSRSLIDIYSIDHGTNVDIIFQDNGIGISPRELKRVTKPLYRGSAQKVGSSRVEGCGMGLAIVDRLVTQIGGSLLIVSKLGKGTSVRIRLPRK